MSRKTTPTSRRGFLGQVAGATVLVAASGLVVGRTSVAGDLPQLDPNDATAQALAYTHESTTDGQMCNNCQLFQGGDAAWGPCAIFPGKEVNAQGWCKSWIVKAS